MLGVGQSMATRSCETRAADRAEHDPEPPAAIANPGPAFHIVWIWRKFSGRTASRGAPGSLPRSAGRSSSARPGRRDRSSCPAAVPQRRLKGEKRRPWGEHPFHAVNGCRPARTGALIRPCPLPGQRADLVRAPHHVAEVPGPTAWTHDLSQIKRKSRRVGILRSRKNHTLYVFHPSGDRPPKPGDIVPLHEHAIALEALCRKSHVHHRVR